jgi:hypothetical protein
LKGVTVVENITNEVAADVRLGLAYRGHSCDTCKYKKHWNCPWTPDAWESRPCVETLDGNPVRVCHRHSDGPLDYVR